MSERLELVVVGGGPAGFAAADGYRAAGGAGPVAIVAGEKRMPYNRPPLSKELLRGESGEADLPLADEAWLSSHEVRLVGDTATAVDAGEHTVTLAGGTVLEYAQCVLATGAEPKRLPVPGAMDPGVRVLRSLDDLRELQARLTDGVPVVVVGSGFIGCEIAASLRTRGHAVTLVSDEPLPNVGRLGGDAAARIRGWLADAGVVLHLDAEVAAIVRNGQGLSVELPQAAVGGTVVVMATGVAPRADLAAASGAAVSDDGAVEVDASMRTSLEGVLAAGDVAHAHNVAAGRALRVEHWGDALGHGEVAGRTAAGARSEWADVPGFWSTIGPHTLKHAAWGDGFDDVRFESHAGGGFTAWYGAGGRFVGVLTHEADEDYERGQALVAAGAVW
jgi:3-phenylpropionate/trans-cinnamate dioxygenase ferredoxin reductase subunit